MARRCVSDLLLLIHMANELCMAVGDLLQVALEECHALQQTPAFSSIQGKKRNHGKELRSAW